MKGKRIYFAICLAFLIFGIAPTTYALPGDYRYMFQYSGPKHQLILNTDLGIIRLDADSTPGANGIMIGNYYHTGYHDYGSIANPDGRYFVGEYHRADGRIDKYRNFIVFEIPSILVGRTINSAKLSIEAPYADRGFGSHMTPPNPFETLSIFDIQTDLDVLQRQYKSGDSTGIAIYNDLGSGTLFAQRAFSATDITTPTEIELNEAALAAISAASGQRIGFGGTLDVAPVVKTNLPPTAVPGPDQQIHTGQAVTLNGTGSYDDNTAAALLQYAWKFTSKPAGSSATLVNANTATPSFVADAVGSYVIQLIVVDEGALSSSPAYVTIASANILPTANAGNPQAVVVGNMVTLNGTASSDPNGDPLSYSWRLVDKPATSVSMLTGASTPTPSFTPDLPGQYVAGLTVNDGFGNSSEVHVVISVIAAQDYAQNRIVDALIHVSAMTSTQFHARGHKNAFSNLLTQAIAALQARDVVEAKSRLEAALNRTDGYPVRGAVDGNGPGMDWITDSDAQTVIYQSLKDALTVL